MKLVLSAVLLAAVPAAVAQNPSPDPNQSAAAPAIGSGHYVGDLSAYKVEPQRSCPVFVTAASVGPAHYLPTALPDSPQKSMLNLHLQYQSRLDVESVRLTVHVRMKNNKYDLDTTDLEIPVAIHATAWFDRAGEHALQFPLPKVYFFGVAQVSIDSITFTSGDVWRPQGRQTCGISGQGSQQVESK